jgi:hypothetical protein
VLCLNFGQSISSPGWRFSSGFFQSLQADVGIVPELGRVCFIPNSFQFILYRSSYFNLLSEIWKLLQNTKRMLIYSYSSLNSGYKNERVWPHVVFQLFTVITLLSDCFMHFIVTKIRYGCLAAGQVTAKKMVNWKNLMWYLSQSIRFSPRIQLLSLSVSLLKVRNLWRQNNAEMPCSLLVSIWSSYVHSLSKNIKGTLSLPLAFELHWVICYHTFL